MISDEYDVPEGWKMAVKDESQVEVGDLIATRAKPPSPRSMPGGCAWKKAKSSFHTNSARARNMKSPSTSRLLIKEGDHVEAGNPLTEGSLNPHTILQIKGRDACEMYLLTEIQKVYRAQGQNINDKHFEVIIRKMLGKVQVTPPG